MKGSPTSNLDKLRKEYNIKYNLFRFSLSQKDKIKYGHLFFSRPEAIVVSFVTDAENKILMGKNPINIYKTVSENPKDFRKKGRKFLENWLNEPINSLIFK